MMTLPTRDNRRGFTLVELIVVMTIMTLIGLFAALAIHNAQDHTKIVRTKALMDLIGVALDQYKQDIGHYPRGTGEGLVTILTEKTSGWKRAGKNRWFEGHEEIKDAWGMPFYYTSHHDYESSGRGVERTPGKGDYYNSSTYQLYSTGPNMKTWPTETADGGHPRLGGTEEDDIRNWKQEKFYSEVPSAYQP
jgi:general secretion pathway protein G